MILYIDRLSNTKYQLYLACDPRTIKIHSQSIVSLISIVGCILVVAEARGKIYALKKNI